jgi:hypothetical protein
VLKRRFEQLIWREVNWQRPFDLENVQEMLVHLASLTTRGPIVWEVRASENRIRYLLGMEQAHQSKIKQAFVAHGDVQFHAAGERAAITGAAQLRLSKPTLALKTDNALAVIRAGLAALHMCRAHEELVLQVILGPAILPANLPQELPDPNASWLGIALGNVGPASNESKAATKEKIAQHGFCCVIRLGATSGNSAIGVNARINSLFYALRTLESAGVRLALRPENPAKLHLPYVPWSFPTRLSNKELAHFLLLPAGKDSLPGTPGLHPKLCLPPNWYRCADSRVFALSADGRTQLSISPNDSLEHTHIIGPTGSGKSTLMQQLVLADIAAGRGVLLIDPKDDLVNDIIARIPPERDSDVVILDPSDPCPVGFNPFTYKESPTLVADAILSVFKEVFSENWGIRSQDVMSAALLTLARCEGSSLLWLPQMLTDEAFRKKITAQVKDPIGLDAYWAGFAAMKDTERRMEIAPVLNKIRQFLLRPGLRNVLGQATPNFDLQDLFTKQRIVLVPLNKGMIGSESAQLLGSLLVGMTWTLALSRAKLPAAQRHLVSIYIDELQDYLSLPTDLSDALAQARGLGVGLTLAHQYREQLPPDIRAGVDANARNKIVFGLNASDAKAFAGMAPELEAEDFGKLPRYHIYTSIQSGGKNTGWLSGQALPPSPATRLPVELRAKSMATYGKPTEQIQAEYLAQLGYTPASPAAPDAADASSLSSSSAAIASAAPIVGRKKVQPPDQSPDQSRPPEESANPCIPPKEAHNNHLRDMTPSESLLDSEVGAPAAKGDPHE